MRHFDARIDDEVAKLKNKPGVASPASRTRTRPPAEPDPKETPRIFLDEPYPENLPVLDACMQCNQGFSLDEEYVACLIECARTGSVDLVRRAKIKRILTDSPQLAERLRKARKLDNQGQVIFQTEDNRVRNVVLKLARGHVTYELSEQMLDAPSHVMIVPLHLLTAAEQSHFEGPPTRTVWPEFGTRAFQRAVISMAGSVNEVLDSDWIEVQEGQYRYMAIADGGILVRIVVGEYLACEVIWRED